MAGQRSNGHSVSRLTVHIVWSTKYRYHVLKGDVQNTLSIPFNTDM